MKKISLFFLILLLSVKCYSQDGYITFDNSTDLYRIKIDTSIVGNVWQIGTPRKLFFNSANSLPNAILTDSISFYPVNNTSVFYLSINPPIVPPWAMKVTEFYFHYKMDCDTLTDYGIIEISLDTGITYSNLLQSSGYQVTDSIGNVVFSGGSGSSNIFTGKNNGWYLFHASLFIPSLSDSIIIRFTFHSDSIQNNRDGWMIDNIAWHTWAEGIDEDILDLKIFPNPAKDLLRVDSKRKIKEVSIVSELGQTLLTCSVTDMPVILNIKSIKQGLYILKIVGESDEILIKKLLVKK